MQNVETEVEFSCKMYNNPCVILQYYFTIHVFYFSTSKNVFLLYESVYYIIN